MTTNNTKKKGINWFKGNSSNQEQSEQESLDKQATTSELVEDRENHTEEPVQSNAQNSNQLFSKDNQDKITLDLIVSIENMLKDRQLIQCKNSTLEEQLRTAHDAINRLKNEQMKKDLRLQEKEREINELENSLTNKQMSYDQLIEDYKDYQNTVNIQFEKISNQLETELNKYNKLNEEYANAQHQSSLKISELEEKVRTLEVENQKYEEQYHKILEEKSELMRSISDFTERMSLSFSPKASTSANSSASE